MLVRKFFMNFVLGKQKSAHACKYLPYKLNIELLIPQI